MWTFRCMLSVPKQHSVELEEKLHSNDTLKNILIRQGLVIGNHQVSVQQELYHGFFELKPLPYYNLLDFDTYTLNGSLDAYMPICITNIKKNTLLLQQLFVNTIFNLEYIQTFKHHAGTTTPEKEFLKCSTLEATCQKLLNWIDILKQNILFFDPNSSNDDDIMRLKEYIQLLHIQFKQTDFPQTSYGHPYIQDIYSCIKERMLPNGQAWTPNIATCTVQYSYGSVQGEFELMYSVQPIKRGHRLLYAIPQEKQFVLQHQIKQRWPMVLEIEELVYVPRQPWNLPVTLNGILVNLFDVLTTNPNWLSENDASFNIDKTSKRYYDILPCGTIEDRYDVLVCKQDRGTIQAVEWRRFT